MKELWRPVVGYEGLYEVSSWGRVRSVDRFVNHINGKRLAKGTLLTPIKISNYLSVNLCKDNIMKLYKIHRLVGMTFPDLVGWTEKAVGKPFDELQINHKDQNKENNCVENLEWCDGPYNANYGNRNEKISKTKTNGKTSKQVYQKTLDGQLVNIWTSTRECERQTGWSQSAISKCCRGEKPQYKGFKWSYTN